MLFGDVDSRLLAGQLSTGGRLTNDDVLTAHVRDIERIRAGLPGLTAVITVLQIFGGRDDAGIGIQSHLRSRLFLGNGHSHFAAGRFVVLSGIADDDILAVQVRHIQGFSRRVPGLTAVGGILHILGGVDGLVLGVQLHDRAIGPCRNDDGCLGAGKLILGRGQPNQDRLAGVVGDLQGLSGLRPSLAAVCGVLHVSGCVDGLIVVVDLDLRLGPATRDYDGDRLAGKLIIIAVVANVDSSPSLVGHI